MSDKKQSVIEFKAFIKRNPELISLVRQGNYTWQSLFEEWYLRGDNDELWKDIITADDKLIEQGKQAKRENVRKSTKTYKHSNQSSDKKEKLSMKKEKKEEESKSDLVASLFQVLKNMDMNQVQQHISSLNQALGAIQGVISQFQENNDDANKKAPERKENPFVIRKD
ncbi:hypothetical protein CVD28_15880 [Bacillus sp. M6-12]|uniref:spore coat protein YlbD n=1 Tax=Bacillus sp. M6-12 TaxID=2054166 RepID=UPI000C75D837|nr:spore coat protein YlbD [Bacillus sp. M6-12]PLS16562.1 hypothetical protein CVD28_15880 [Bacillus sp. M6-12]